MPKDMALASRQADAPAWAALRIRVALDRLATDARECGLDFTAHMIEAAAEAAAESGASLATAYRIDDDAPIGRGETGSRRLPHDAEPRQRNS
jgi:hypothetical protein